MKNSWNNSPAADLILPDLPGRTAVVTGAAQGIGRATAKKLIANGVRVFGFDCCASDLQHELFVPIRCDLSDVAELERACQEIRALTSRLDHLVNVAGVDPKYLIDDVRVEQWDKLIDLNLRAYFLAIKGLLPLLRNGGGRSIVNVSSINYRLGVPGRAAYSASKAGILGLSYGLSRELGREGIRINTVSPGWVFTDRQIQEYFSGEQRNKNLEYLEHQQSIKLQISPEDVANHILFYLSDVSRASTGHNCVVDAGWILE